MEIKAYINLLICDTLALSNDTIIDDNQELFGSYGLGLDSLDYLSITSDIEDKYKIDLGDINPEEIMSFISFVKLVKQKYMDVKKNEATN